MRCAVIFFAIYAGSECPLLMGTLPVTASNLTLSSNQAVGSTRAPLTFAERETYQLSIEEVYWRHRIWPKDNPQPKPPLNVLISQSQLEKEVEDYLSKSQFVADQWGRPITANELQGEMDRIASHTKQPDVLRELFAALGNDPFVITECLVRPIFVERVIRDLNAQHGSGAKILASPRGAATVVTATKVAQTSYRLPKISTDCTDDIWTAITAVNAPDGRSFHSVVWTGSEMIVWGGFNFNGRLNTGGKYSPSTDSWISTSLVNAPSLRDYHSAVWTGIEMIVWGGEVETNTGGRYNPLTDTWAATSTTNAPTPRAAHTAIWTGSEMIVWGGRNAVGWFNTGGRYNPSTDSWVATSTINAPEARWYHTTDWIGNEMIVWGGTNQTIYLNTGGTYNPSTDSWASTGLVNAPLGRIAHTAIWSGTEMTVWGGVDSTFNDTNTGGRYNPTEDSWMAISTVNAPSARDSHTAVWNGSEMIVWGGVFCCPAIDFDTGGRYNATTDSWTGTSTANAPLARWAQTAVWIGSEMLVWGGYNDPSNVFLDTGGRYCAESAATPTPTPSATATPTATATATPRIDPTPRARPTPHRRP